MKINFFSPHLLIPSLAFVLNLPLTEYFASNFIPLNYFNLILVIELRIAAFKVPYIIA